MGKVTIVSSLGEGLYRVKVEFENARVASSLALITEELAKVNLELIDLAAQKSTAHADYNADITALNSYISSTNPEIYTADPTTLNQLTAATYETRIKYDDVRQKENYAKLRKTSMELNKDYLQNYCPNDIDIDAWCVAYVEDLTGITGSIENDYAVKLSTNRQTINDETGVWLPEKITVPDSQLQHPLATSQHANWFNLCTAPMAQRHKGRYRIATITSIDYVADTCSLIYEGQFNIFEHDAKIMPELPIIPQVPGTLTQSNTVTGANITYLTCNARSFLTGDRVIVDLHDGIGVPTVIGFVSHPRKCRVPYMWGDNIAGQLGLGDNVTRTEFTKHDINFSIVSMGSQHTGGIKNNILYMFGGSQDGALGLGDIVLGSNIPLILEGSYLDVSCGWVHSLFLTTAGDIYASGDKSVCLGIGEDLVGNQYTPAFVGSGYKKIFAGFGNSWGIKNNDELYCWGVNDALLGNGDTINVTTPTFSGYGYKKIVSAEFHTLALKLNGDLMVTGGNTHGQIGLVSPATIYTFTLLGTNYKDIAAGQFTSMAIKDNGDLYIFGIYSVSTKTPTLIGSGFKAVVCNGINSFMLHENGDLYWIQDRNLDLIRLVGTGYTGLIDIAHGGASMCAFK